jgi:hypothetical protein
MVWHAKARGQLRRELHLSISFDRSINHGSVYATHYTGYFSARTSLRSCNDSPVDVEGNDKPEELYYTAILDNLPIVYAIRSDGTGRRVVVEDGNLYSASVGDKVVAWKQGYGMVVCKPTGEVLHTIAPLGEQFNFYPYFSPRGDKFVYQEFYGLGKQAGSHLHVVDIDGRNEVVMEADSARESAPVWSPDGMRLAFLKIDTDNDDAKRDSLFVINNNGTGRRFLTTEAEYLDGGDCISWSPDGKRVVCINRTDTQYNLLIVDVANGAAQKITSDRTIKSRPAWSPDGMRIAYLGATVQGMPNALYTIRPDGTDMKEQYNGDNNFVTQPRWSPGSNKIAILTSYGKDINLWLYAMRVCDLTSGTATMVDTLVRYGIHWR